MDSTGILKQNFQFFRLTPYIIDIIHLSYL